MASFMAKERISTQMEEFTKESGKIVSHGMAKERISTQMEEFTKERLKMASFMAIRKLTYADEASTKERL